VDLHHSGLRVSFFLAPDRDPGSDDPVLLRRAAGAVADQNNSQHLVVYGRDHGDRYRPQERHPDARLRTALHKPRAAVAEGYFPGGQKAITTNPDDGAGDDFWHAPAGPGHRLGRGNFAPACHRGHRRRDGINVAIAARDARAILSAAGKRAVGITTEAET